MSGIVQYPNVIKQYDMFEGAARGELTNSLHPRHLLSKEMILRADGRRRWGER